MNSKLLFTFLLALITPTAYSQAPDMNARLDQLELKMEKFVSGQQKIAAGYAELPIKLQQVACSAYPIVSDREAIEGYRSELASLDASDPTPEQRVRITLLQNVVAGLHAGVDCSRLPQSAQSADSGT